MAHRQSGKMGPASAPSDAAVLFRPFALKGLTLPNRIVMSPMGRLFSKDGVLDPANVEYYRRRVEGGAGLVIGEAAVIDDRAAAPFPQASHFYGDAALAAWGAVANAVHEAGGYFIPQLWHSGLVREVGSEPNSDEPPIGPSGWVLPLDMGKGRAGPGWRIGAPMSRRRIDHIINAYAESAAAAKAIGCDGVELHAAHGYLIDQFFWSPMNRRRDRYGGNIRRRAQFAAEIVAEIRRRVGPEFPVLLRFSHWKLQDYGARLFNSPQQCEEFLAPLVDAGVDLFDCSTRRFWMPAFPSSELCLAAWVKKISGRPTMAVGSVGLDAEQNSIVRAEEGGYEGYFGTGNLERDRANPASIETLLRMMGRDEFDLVGVGRAHIANPDWARKVRDGDFAGLAPYTRAALTTLA